MEWNGPAMLVHVALFTSVSAVHQYPAFTPCAMAYPRQRRMRGPRGEGYALGCERPDTRDLSPSQAFSSSFSEGLTCLQDSKLDPCSEIPSVGTACDLLHGDIRSYMHATKPVEQRIFDVGSETSSVTKHLTDVGPFVLGQAKSMLGRT